MFIKQVTYNRPVDHDVFPHNAAALRFFESLTFTKSITLLVGENGTGKSTLLQAIASHTQLRKMADVGSDINHDYRDEQWSLYDAFRLSWGQQTQQGFQFSATDFIKFIERDEEQRYYGARRNGLFDRDLSELSHGQGFLDLFHSSLVEGALYILDEPESPLSPQNQLALAADIYAQAQQGSQFIIATHSPILMALPNVSLFEISEAGVHEQTFADIDSVRFLQSFLAHPEVFMHHLLQSEDDHDNT
jgi:predicted ATPase